MSAGAFVGRFSASTAAEAQKVVQAVAAARDLGPERGALLQLDSHGEAWRGFAPGSTVFVADVAGRVCFFDVTPVGEGEAI